MDGRLISVEGISGVGKTTLTRPFVELLRREGQRVTSLDGFSERTASSEHDLGRDILRALISAADGDRFLRGGHPAAETLLLLAIKTFDYERYCLPALHDGCVVIEGRSLHSIAVYQSLILHADNDHQAFAEAQEILRHGARWRPLPDVTLLITDDVTTAIDRLQRRDAIRCTAAERYLHHRASSLFAKLADADTARIRVIDRRDAKQDLIISQMLSAVS
jgi:dTMP kinase